MASNFRYNPFDNVLEPVAIVDELQVVGFTSPYTIKLSEIPAKMSPSTLKIKYQDTGTDLTEVAANPAVGEFWPDYSTNANNDESWNTGTIKFNAADAGKAVLCSYDGIGTLVDIRGIRSISLEQDWKENLGTGANGSVTATNGATYSGEYNFVNFTVPAGVTIYINKYAKFRVQGVFDCKGVISGYGRGTAGGAAGVYVDPVGGNGSAGARGSFAGGGTAGEWKGDYYQGGAGGTCWGPNNTTYSGSCSTANIENFLLSGTAELYGAGGGGGPDLAISSSVGAPGGAGGAGITIIAKIAKLTGTINMNGAAGGTPGGQGGHGGAGGGGAVVIAAQSIANTGNISVAGGYPGWYRLIQVEA